MLIAFFGGLAGVIAITRVEKGNPIPGVAIAAQLLCHHYVQQVLVWQQVISSSFLEHYFFYTINCVFIGISTFLIVKFLKYPSVKIRKI